MANTKISALTANTNPNWSEEFVYAYNNANGKITLNTMKTYATSWTQATLVSGTNIKTINGNDILGSWNLVISWGGGSVTTLNADANIWELSEWEYVTTYDLYYKSGEKVPRMEATWATHKMRLSVVSESWWQKWYLVYNVCHRNTAYGSWGWYWYSISSSDGVFYDVRQWDATIRWVCYTYNWWIDTLSWKMFTQVSNNFQDNSSSLRIASWQTVYAWMTYTIYVASYDSWEDANITLWTWVTNPLNITLPTSCTKPFVITLLATSTTTAIVTWCTIQA